MHATCSKLYLNGSLESGDSDLLAGNDEGMQKRRQEGTCHELELLVGNQVFQTTEEGVGDDEEVSRGFVATENVLGQVCILASVHN